MVLSVADRTCPSCRLPLPDGAAYCDQCGAPATTQVFGETLSGTRRNGAVAASYELEPERLQRALGTNFELGPLIGRGGYAEVFAIRDLRLKRDLAIKVLRPDLLVTPSILARFRREAEAVAALAHPNIVPVYDIGEADGVCFIVMPLIQGESLKARLGRQRRLPVDEVRRIVSEAANALAAAHKAGVVHRDIKPENIMLEGPEGRVRVMDFGIAKAMDPTDAQLTGTGVIMGTPQYMSPEQASGDPNVDQRTDQYSLAVVAYQMMSGRAPFEGDTARAIMTKQLLEEPTPLPELVENLPGPISAALFRALQKDPKKRFDSIEEFAQTLGASAVDQVPSWQPSVPSAPRQTSRWLLWALAAAVLLVGWFGLTRLRPPTSAALPPPPPPEAGAVSPPVPAAVNPAAAGAPQPPAPLPTPTLRPITPPTKTVPETVIVNQPARVDTPTAAAPATCQEAVNAQDWGLAYHRCSVEAETNPLAARQAAELASDGRGTTADQRTANQWYEIAAQNDPTSALTLAKRFDQGVGGERDPSRALDFYLRAARANVPEAYLIVAQRLEQGVGAPRNEGQAASWYERAAAGGHLPSQLKVANWYAQGRVLARNDSAARVWYEQAALQGNPSAQYELAKLLFRGGKGVPRRDTTALEWLQRAAGAGHVEAKRELDRRVKP